MEGRACIPVGSFKFGGASSCVTLLGFCFSLDGSDGSSQLRVALLTAYCGWLTLYPGCVRLSVSSNYRVSSSLLTLLAALSFCHIFKPVDDLISTSCLLEIHVRSKNITLYDLINMHVCNNSDLTIHKY